KAAMLRVADPSLVSDRVPDITGFSQTYFITRGLARGGAASGCPRDSGGPVFRDYSTALVGVNSGRFFIPGTTIGEYNYHARPVTDAAAQWLHSLLYANG